jgi:hypothetical protein
MMKLTRAAMVTLGVVVCALAQESVPTTPLSHRGSGAADLPELAQPQTLTVPAETQVKVTMLSGIDTGINRVNDPVIAQVREPVFVKGKIALPPGSLLDGHITFVRPRRHMHRPGELGMRFDRISLPDGQEKPVSALLAALEHPELLNFHLDAEGHLVGNRTISWKTLFGGATALGAYGALKIVAIGSAGATLALPLGGAAIIGYEAFWRHGREVDIPPQTQCRLRLSYPVIVHVPW